MQPAVQPAQAAPMPGTDGEWIAQLYNLGQGHRVNFVSVAQIAPCRQAPFRPPVGGSQVAPVPHAALNAVFMADLLRSGRTLVQIIASVSHARIHQDNSQQGRRKAYKDSAAGTLSPKFDDLWVYNWPDRAKTLFLHSRYAPVIYPIRHFRGEEHDGAYLGYLAVVEDRYANTPSGLPHYQGHLLPGLHPFPTM